MMSRTPELAAPRVQGPYRTMLCTDTRAQRWVRTTGSGTPGRMRRGRERRGPGTQAAGEASHIRVRTTRLISITVLEEREGPARVSGTRAGEPCGRAMQRTDIQARATRTVTRTVDQAPTHTADCPALLL